MKPATPAVPRAPLTESLCISGSIKNHGYETLVRFSSVEQIRICKARSPINPAHCTQIAGRVYFFCSGAIAR